MNANNRRINNPRDGAWSMPHPGNWMRLPRRISFAKPNDPYYNLTNYFWYTDIPRHVRAQGPLNGMIPIDGCLWPGVEAFFQAMKFDGQAPRYQEAIRACDHPDTARIMGAADHIRDYHGNGANLVITRDPQSPFCGMTVGDARRRFIPGNFVFDGKLWATPQPGNGYIPIRLRVMAKALNIKFGFKADGVTPTFLRQELMKTVSYVLIEANSHDEYWGYGASRGGGKNMLGRMLMAIRKNGSLTDADLLELAKF